MWFSFVLFFRDVVLLVLCTTVFPRALQYIQSFSLVLWHSQLRTRLIIKRPHSHIRYVPREQSSQSFTTVATRRRCALVDTSKLTSLFGQTSDGIHRNEIRVENPTRTTEINPDLNKSSRVRVSASRNGPEGASRVWTSVRARTNCKNQTNERRRQES